MELPFSPTVGLQLEPALRRGIRQAQATGQPVLVSVAEPSISFDPIQVFERAASVTAERNLWFQPDEDFALVGLGSAHTVEALNGTRFAEVSTAWRQVLSQTVLKDPRGMLGIGPLLLGGFTFDAHRPATELWDGFPSGRMVLPSVLLTRYQEESWLTYNVMVEADTDPEEAMEALSALVEKALEESDAPWRDDVAPVMVKTQELRPGLAWQADVAKAAQNIEQGGLEKVVLARAVQISAKENFDAGRALRELAAHYTGCYIFAFAHAERCFLGATPERLARLRTGEVRTMSLAGSIRRGKTLDEDRQLGQTLLNSAKDRHEHRVVIKAIVEALYPLCTTLTVGETQLLKLGNIQHLSTPISGELADGQTILDLVERLHPTPAVGGRPREAALKFIREHEKLDRGWYAAPVGWVDHRGQGEFAVALRSALLRGNHATLFAGCGIMADSDPEREYAESNLKLKPMLNALT